MLFPDEKKKTKTSSRLSLAFVKFSFKSGSQARLCVKRKPNASFLFLLVFVFEAVRFTQGTQDFPFILARFVNRTESLARNTIIGKTWQDFSGVTLRANSCKKNLAKIEQFLVFFSDASEPRSVWPVIERMKGLPSLFTAEYQTLCICCLVLHWRQKNTLNYPLSYSLVYAGVEEPCWLKLFFSTAGWLLLSRLCGVSSICLFIGFFIWFIFGGGGGMIVTKCQCCMLGFCSSVRSIIIRMPKNTFALVYWDRACMQ